MRSSYLQPYSLTSFLKGLTQSLLTGMHFSKASVAHCPSLWEKERPRKQLALQVRAAGRAPWPWLEVAPLPLHPVPRDLGTLSFWEQGHQNQIQQRWDGIEPFNVPPSHSPCIPELAVPPLRLQAHQQPGAGSLLQTEVQRDALTHRWCNGIEGASSSFCTTRQWFLSTSLLAATD